MTIYEQNGYVNKYDFINTLYEKYEYVTDEEIDNALKEYDADEYFDEMIQYLDDLENQRMEDESQKEQEEDDKIDEMIDYMKENNIPIVTVDEVDLTSM